jgi:hypothetical protein
MQLQLHKVVTVGASSDLTHSPRTTDLIIVLMSSLVPTPRHIPCHTQFN